jgi:hypothetical protein
MERLWCRRPLKKPINLIKVYFLGMSSDLKKKLQKLNAERKKLFDKTRKKMLRELIVSISLPLPSDGLGFPLQFSL